MTERTTKGIYYTVGSPTGSWHYNEIFENIFEAVDFVKKSKGQDLLSSEKIVIFMNQWKRVWEGDDLIEYDQKQIALTDKGGMLLK